MNDNIDIPELLCKLATTRMFDNGKIADLGKLQVRALPVGVPRWMMISMIIVCHNVYVGFITS
jgi:hypothetical protein